MLSRTKTASALLAGCLSVALAACGGQDETAYEVDATTNDGSQLIVSEPTPGAAPVVLPEAPVTVTTETQSAISPTPLPATPTPAPTPTATTTPVPMPPPR